mmetsp:Transcript_17222/g.39804  ORF Transcript_17222/g.39804 Transcript_17222/m.39804 type:complete len:172 (-) Transcript_17222:197-712(-)|eukprot:CAMPEP_0197174418 /NCGR_PEP_ID=MMETSP1423-20130617/946_1 /TAXON_ID=476441 /ORGANISM="Pseudo-nitzschia heimii, Strain UNC1101" /LENGTH=171 /DNA_ID=CAMNT_0042623343 /DNA_START=86 /DNA_END=601 /DNA_ORIENTATION=+
MKISVPQTLAVVALSSHTCDAFSTLRQPARSTALKAANFDDTEGVMTRRTAAAVVASLVAAPMAAQAAETALDFSLPSYDSKMGGFGEGAEAYLKKGEIPKGGGTASELMTDPGSDEREKQAASMRKAEEARKIALAKKKAEQKERDEEAKRRAIEKKKRDKERLANIWNS